MANEVAVFWKIFLRYIPNRGRHSEWQSTSIFLRSIMSANSLPLPDMVPTFKVATLTSTFWAIHFCLWLWTRLPTLLLFHFWFCPAVVQFPPVPCWATSPMAAVVSPGSDQSGMKIWFWHICIMRWHRFYAGCLSWRNPPHLSGLGTGHWNHTGLCTPVAWLRSLKNSTGKSTSCMYMYNRFLQLSKCWHHKNWN